MSGVAISLRGNYPRGQLSGAKSSRGQLFGVQLSRGKFFLRGNCPMNVSIFSMVMLGSFRYRILVLVIYHCLILYNLISFFLFPLEFD